MITTISEKKSCAFLLGCLWQAVFSTILNLSSVVIGHQFKLLYFLKHTHTFKMRIVQKLILIGFIFYISDSLQIADVMFQEWLITPLITEWFTLIEGCEEVGCWEVEWAGANFGPNPSYTCNSYLASSPPPPPPYKDKNCYFILPLNDPFDNILFNKLLVICFIRQLSLPFKCECMCL